MGVVDAQWWLLDRVFQPVANRAAWYLRISHWTIAKGFLLLDGGTLSMADGIGLNMAMNLFFTAVILIHLHICEFMEGGINPLREQWVFMRLISVAVLVIGGGLHVADAFISHDQKSVLIAISCASSFGWAFFGSCSTPPPKPRPKPAFAGLALSTN